MSKDLIKTSTLAYKIKTFFRSLLNKNKKNSIMKEDNINFQKDKNKFLEDISLIERTKLEEKNKELAEKVMNFDITLNELTDKETEDMIKYFKEDIRKKNEELEKIKKHIVEMRKELLNG